MLSFQEFCTQYAQIAKGNATLTNGVCSVEIDHNLNTTIQVHPSRSALPTGRTFKSFDIP